MRGMAAREDLQIRAAGQRGPHPQDDFAPGGSGSVESFLLESPDAGLHEAAHGSGFTYHDRRREKKRGALAGAPDDLRERETQGHL